MIILQMMGGLGNQMQIYALYRKLLRCGNDKDIKFDLSWFDNLTEKQREDAKRELLFELPFFEGLEIPVCTDDELKCLLKKKNSIINRFFPWTNSIFCETEMYHPEIFKLKNKYVSGYFGCQYYYDDIMGELRNLFIFPKHPDEELHLKNMGLIHKMSHEYSVSVHIRRGDYENPGTKERFGGICTDEYYDSAINFFKSKNVDVHFYIFSNDIEYVEGKFKSDEYTIIKHNTGENSMLDMQLMSACKGNICANSTFSFWGARLNKNKDKIAIRPLKMTNSDNYSADVIHELWNGWYLVDNNGAFV